MLSKISHLAKSAFKPKQLLLRQNGDVSMLTLPSSLQVSLLCAAIGAVCWISVSSHGYLQQQDQIQTLEKQHLTAESNWQLEKQQLKQKLAEQTKTLQDLSKQQNLLEGLVEALPESVTSPASTEKQVTQDDKFEEKSQDLAHKQASLLNHIEKSITARSSELHTHLDEIGLDKQTSLSPIAQGGPYHQLDTQHISTDYLHVIDKLVELNELEQMITLLPDSMPVKKDKFYVSSQFGYRKDPITGRRAMHKGVDLAGWHKTDIHAPAAGTVTKAGKNGGYGKFVEIEHANGLVTRFGHLHTIKVKKGQKVEKSDVIALMGSTGRSTSTHLHYEVLQNGKHINPIKLAKVLSRVQ
ncbi:M23 family metallopeptidase [Pseudoalteromonas phenolica]|uniref:M23 family metallopeptidase n=1 Tax=Pseudoalteromonas phenolica TaxID=161398 RepID=UPI00110AD5A8|nr:M23 family metallopeptidase [Pseudoalteromonas phenolica]TMO57562.1 M23 family peptidase [Pseudoalteromonas phenolica]